MDERDRDIEFFEKNKDELVKRSHPQISVHAEKLGMTVEEYLRYWIYQGLAPDVRVLLHGEEQSFYFPTLD